jgi:hypothetical protein
MVGERQMRPMLLKVLGEADRFQAGSKFRALDPVKEISLRLLPNDHLEARFWPVTSYRSLALPFTPLSGFRLPPTGRY